MGRGPEALEAYSKSLDIKVKVVGPLVADTNLNIGAVYEKLGRFEEALVQHGKAQEVYVAVYGDGPHISGLTHPFPTTTMPRRADQAGPSTEQRGARDEDAGSAGIACSIMAHLMALEAHSSLSQDGRPDTKGPLLPLLCQARHSECVRTSSLHHVCPYAIAGAPGSPVDCAATNCDRDDAAAATATLPTAACSHQLSPEAPASQGDGSASGVLPDMSNESPLERAHEEDDGTLLSLPPKLPGRGDWGRSISLYAALYEPGDEILLQRRTRQMPLEERRSRRYSKPQSFVC